MKILQTKYSDAFSSIHFITDGNERLEGEIKSLSIRTLKLEGVITKILVEGSYVFLK